MKDKNELPSDEELYNKGQEYSDSLMFGPHPPLSDPIWQRINAFETGDQLLAANFLHGRVTSVTPFLMKEQYKVNPTIWDINRKPENAFRWRKLTADEINILFDFSSIEILDRNPGVWKKTPQEIHASHTAYKVLEIQFPWENPVGHRYDYPYITSTYNGYNICSYMGLENETLGWCKGRGEDATHNYYINPGKRYCLCSDELSEIKSNLDTIQSEIRRLDNLITKRERLKVAPPTIKLKNRIKLLQEEYKSKEYFHGIIIR